MQRNAGSATADEPSAPERVGWGFILLYAVSYTGGSLLFLAPLLVSLALKVNDLVGIDAAPRNLALVTSVGSLLSIVANPLFGRISDRTTSRFGMRRPWMVTGVAVGAAGILIVALASNIATVLVGWCVCQVFFNATLAAQERCCPTRCPANNAGGVRPHRTQRPRRLGGWDLPGAGVRLFDRPIVHRPVRRRRPLGAPLHLAPTRQTPRPSRQAAVVAS